MNDVLNTLDIAHQQLKNTAIQSIQADEEIPQLVLDCIKSVYALKQAIKQANPSPSPSQVGG